MGLLDFFKSKKQQVHSVGSVEQIPILVSNELGQQFQITREQWREDVLPANLKLAWNEHTKLYWQIVKGLDDKFAEEVLSAAVHLSKVDAERERGLVILVVVLLQLGRNDEARVAAERGLQELPSSAYLMTNWAKALHANGDIVKADLVLERSLNMDPNQENALGLYVAQSGAGGIEAQENVYRRIAENPKSWRSQMWLARFWLERKQLQQALNLYELVLHRCNPLVSDAFMQISGDLGKAGYIDQILPLLEDFYQIDAHGIEGANNLLKTYFETKQSEKARKLLELLYGKERFDWRETLAFWDGEFDKLDKSYGVQKSTESLGIEVLELDRPVWARRDKLLEDFGLGVSAQVVIFVCGSAAAVDLDIPNEVVVGKTEIRGAFTRGSTLFLAENLALFTDATVKIWAPMVSNEHRGFVLSGQPWRVSDFPKPLANEAVFVMCHLNTNTNPWRYESSVIDASTQEVKWATVVDIDPATPALGVISLSLQLLDVVADKLQLKKKKPPDWFSPISPDWLLTI